MATLAKLLADGTEHCMVRHEAAEGLGAIGSADCLQIVRNFCADACLEVAQTCQLAVQRIDYFQNENQETNQQFPTIDPAPPADACICTTELQQRLTDEAAPIFERYRALFALRNKGGSEAVVALGMSFACNSALLKHEVAYVLGQMAEPQAVQILRKVLHDHQESAMVRHEAAEALGAIADDSCLAVLQNFREDPDQIVADSCEVALDMFEFELSGSLNYVDLGLQDI